MINTRPEKSSVHSRGRKLAAVFFWLTVVGAYQWYAAHAGLSPLGVVQRLLGLMRSDGWGPLLYIGLYILRPVIFFPSLPLTLAGGFVFGPVAGTLYTVIASNLSSSTAYLIGRYFGHGLFGQANVGNFVNRYAGRLRARSFETVLIMRFLFLPYDLVTYAAGLIGMQFTPFILATALGTLPGTMAIVGFGAAITQFDGGLPRINGPTLAASVAILLLSLGVSWILHRREGSRKTNAK